MRGEVVGVGEREVRGWVEGYGKRGVRGGVVGVGEGSERWSGGCGRGE